MLNIIHIYIDNTYIHNKHKQMYVYTYISKNNKYSIKEVNDKDSKFKAHDRGRISKYRNIFAKGYTPNLPGKTFVIKKSSK